MRDSVTLILLLYRLRPPSRPGYCLVRPDGRATALHLRLPLANALLKVCDGDGVNAGVRGLGYGEGAFGRGDRVGVPVHAAEHARLRVEVAEGLLRLERAVEPLHRLLVVGRQVVREDV